MKKIKVNKTKLILGIMLGSLIGLLFGISYAGFSYLRNGTTNNQLITGDIYMRYNDTKQISLTNAFPSISYTGGDYLEFTITGKNTSDKTIYYEIILNHGDSQNNKTRIEDEFLSFRLVDTSDLTTDLLTTTRYYTIDNERIYVGTIGQTNSYTKTYRLYMWINNDVTIAGGEIEGTYDASDWNSLFASIEVDVKGDIVPKSVAPKVEVTYNPVGGKVFPSKKQLTSSDTTYGELATPTKTGYSFLGWYTDETNGTLVQASTTFNSVSSAKTLYAHWEVAPPTITSCPDCVYTKTLSGATTWSSKYTPTTFTDSEIENGTTSDYTSLNSHLFLGLKFENNQVTNAYVCGIYNYGSENEQPFCIEGWSDGTKQSTNMGIITPIFGSENCNVSGYCGVPDDYTVITAPEGYVDEVLESSECVVSNNGGFACYL